MKPDLRNVTLVSYEWREPAKAIRQLAAMCELCEFGDVKYLNHFQGYQQFMWWENFEAWKYIKTTHALFIHFDGYIVHPEAWEPDFLKYDYIGAPWPVGYAPEGRVGNGGFCLKSRALMNEVATLPYDKDSVSDYFVCCVWRNYLEKVGMKFAPVAVAARFSIEKEIPEYTGKSFGFHGMPEIQKRYPVWV